MSEEKKTKVNASFSFPLFGILTVVLITMKLIPGNEVYSSWPWFSFNPFVGSVLMFLITWPAIIIGVLLVVLLVAVIIAAAKK